MRVTLDVFSGRPNPTWQLNAARSAELYQRCRAMGSVAPRPLPARLGFRGIVVHQWDPMLGCAPAQAFQIAATTNAVTDDDVDTARWLLAASESAVDDDLADAVIGDIAMRAAAAPLGDGDGDIDADDGLAVAVGACPIRATPMSLAYWNNPSVQPFNNCYNYASNFVSGSLAQPGRRSGASYAGFTCGQVLAAARRDGLRTDCAPNVGVVALGIWPGYDFHWWRLHVDGEWAHKIGRWPAQNVDNSYRRLDNGLTPATCDRGPYVEFCGYYFVPPTMWVA